MEDGLAARKEVYFFEGAEPLIVEAHIKAVRAVYGIGGEGLFFVVEGRDRDVEARWRGAGIQRGRVFGARIREGRGISRVRGRGTGGEGRRQQVVW